MYTLEGCVYTIYRGYNMTDETYKCCRNCKYQPEPLTACDWLKEQTQVFKLCPCYEPKDADTPEFLNKKVNLPDR